ncbi:LOW QUALITY PROTEIN: protein SIEVE ELEMENT OCCLUSION B-like [Dioscorea cayenensis subsp. rotundata]|uniref:LOW QUALITY PROTEIN: protein SIEVE ELEMENT OCCLUSION B-like n=1 Tax=Dioscorea cayennensis subsp. rotundata TaxID=55577 RepID=A0AB40C313_DIOCR|nr:LOW QUALITY PROTEIN: protein SIEVE ELEMENT OCCLUSION B-like [Dioscorea cayenensis subsp. rotundata]
MAGTVEQQQRMQLIKGERHLFSSSDDAIVMKQILATHAPDGREVEVRPILNLVEDILRRATPTAVMVPQAHELELVEDKAQKYEVTSMLEALAYPIHRISSEITYKCSGGGEAHATALALFQTLSTYTWDAKLVLTLAAFAVTYGGFWLSAQIYTVNPLAKSIAQLKQLPDILEQTDVLKPRFDAINNLIKAMLDVTKCIIEFKELPTEYIPLDSPDINLAMAHIPTAVYWIVRSVLACASQIIALIGLGHEYMSSTTEAWELSSLAHKVANIHGHHDKKISRFYQTLVRLFETIHLDNMKILKALIYSKDDLPLIEGTTKKRVRVDVLRRKIVLLFITDLDITPEELFVLIQIYNDTHQGKVERHYEIVWLPIINLHVSLLPSKETTFDQLSSVMPWYSLQHPALLDKAVVKYIRDVWHFDKKPILVVLDPQGKVVCPNALHMMWIWGSLAFPFTSAREEALWKEETWRLELLIDEIDPTIVEWAREGRHICLYGGEDIDWIRQFTTTMKHITQETRIPIEMVYVGKSNRKEKNKKIISIIAAEKLSSYWEEPAMIWFFWVRIESMWHSKRQHGHTVDTDQIMQEVTQMLSFDGSDEGWAVFSRGLMEIVKSSAKKLLDCLNEFDGWKGNIELVGFVRALENALAPYWTHEHCTRLILPGETGVIKEEVVCAECKKPMDQFVLYRCCNE